MTDARRLHFGISIADIAIRSCSVDLKAAPGVELVNKAIGKA